jgi:cytochrome c5
MKMTSLVLAVSLAALLSACGKQESAAPEASAPAAPEAAAPEAAAPAAEPAMAENTIGKGVFNKVCSLCHAAGVAGAPKLGDKADWGPRIAQGKDMLYKHALEGFTGAKGMMPARGGSTTLTDDEVKAGVDYMTSKAE